MTDALNKERFAQIATELGRLRQKVRQVRELPAEQTVEGGVELRTRSSLERSEALLRRVVELREAIEMQRRRLERLRARMRQIRGGFRPH